jgi:hypothetical protein
MNYKGNIFINTIQNENCFTELFTNLLKYDDFRTEILSLIIDNRNILESVEYENITTQKRLENIGQPDIRLCNDKIDIIFEIKVSSNRELTGKQKDDYIQHLADKTKIKKIVFIVPQNYKRDNIPQQDTAIITWELIINKLECLPFIETSNNNIPAIIKDEYLDFLKDWFSIITFDLQTLQLMNNKEIPKALENFYALVDIVKRELAQLNPNLQLSTSMSKNDYGIGIKSNNFTIYFGLWFYCWWKTGFPLSISILAPKDLDKEEEVKNYYKSKNFSEPQYIQNTELNGKRWYAVPISNEVLISSDCIYRICTILVDLEQIINSNH